MQTDIVKLAPGEKPEDAYRRLMTTPKTYRLAAHVARNHRLGKHLAVFAAYKAYCYYDTMAEKQPEFRALADGVLKEFDLKLVEGEIIRSRNECLVVLGEPIEGIEAGALIVSHVPQAMAN